ncbi:MAG: hypothetical protein EA357_06920 [Micavibrio sp.]|nr:MAG: hypothetical protein EA357_06920 [Micavibrio sp.]
MTAEKIVFYHHPCLDGSASAWAALQAFGRENTVYQGYTHDEKDVLRRVMDEKIGAETEVLFCDIVPPPDMMRDLPEKAAKLTIYDHHVTAQKQLSEFAHPKCDIVFDMQRSGAGLTWDMLHPGVARPFVIELVEAMDLYRTDALGASKDFFTCAAALDMIDLADFDGFMREFSVLAEMDAPTARKTLMERGAAQRALYIEKIDAKLDSAVYVTLEGVEALGGSAVAFFSGDIKKLGREFWYRFQKQAARDPKILMVCREEPETETVALSFRSAPGCDVSCAAEEIGSKYGISGGGHKNAAAVRLTYEQFDPLVRKWKLPID